MGVGAITLKLTKGVFIMQNLFKNKLFIILSLFIILVAFISSSCFASFDFEYNEQSYSVPYLPSGYQYYLICVNINPSYRYVICSNSEITYSSWMSGSTPRGEVSSLSLYVVTFHDDDFWYEIDNNNTFSDSSLYQSQIIYSNFDVYNTYQSHNELVFQAPPHQVEEQETPQQIQQVTIPAIQQVEEIPQGMSQVLQMIIPIGLIVLSIGLVVYLTRLVIYRMKS